MKVEHFTKKKNIYPIYVIDNHIKMFLEIQYTTIQYISNENTINNNKKAYFKLPYIETFFKRNQNQT